MIEIQEMSIRSSIEVNEESGKETLIVFYDAQKDDFDRAINQALTHHGLEHGQLTTIAIPERQIT